MTLTGHEGGVTSPAWSPDGERLVGIRQLRYGMHKRARNC